MTQKEIDLAFENRWRIKFNQSRFNSDIAACSLDTLAALAKDFCRDFFEAGILLAEGSVSGDTIATYSEVCDINAPFEKFWDAYDKKVARPKCEKLWSKLSMAERVACLNYIPLYKQAQPDKKYRKNPETFLRNKSWNDELIFRNNGTDKQSQRNQRFAEVAERIAEYTKDTE